MDYNFTRGGHDGMVVDPISDFLDFYGDMVLIVSL